MAPKIKIYRDFPQRSDKWLEIKKGKTSGSGIKPILTARTNKTLETYAYSLIAQEENTEPLKYESGFLSKSVQWGVDQEEFAIKAFEEKTGKMVEDVAWIESLDPKLVGRSGASPDGLITIYEFIEVKCLSTSNHVKYVTENQLPTEYKPQILNYFMINQDLKVVYFILYDIRVKDESKQLHIIPILREDHEREIETLYDKVIEFHDLKDALHAQYKGVKSLTKKDLNKLVG